MMVEMGRKKGWGRGGRCWGDGGDGFERLKDLWDGWGGEGFGYEIHGYHICLSKADPFRRDHGIRVVGI